MSSGSPVCPHPQPWHCVTELRSPQTLSSLIIIFLQIEQDPFQLPLAQQQPQPARPLGHLSWGGRLGASREREHRRKMPLSALSVLQPHHSSLGYQLRGQNKLCCPKRGCLVLVTPQRIPPSFLLNPLTGAGGRSHIFKASLPNMLPRFISANPTHGTQIAAFSSIRKSKSLND